MKCVHLAVVGQISLKDIDQAVEVLELFRDYCKKEGVLLSTVGHCETSSTLDLTVKHWAAKRRIPSQRSKEEAEALKSLSRAEINMVVMDRANYVLNFQTLSNTRGAGAVLMYCKMKGITYNVILTGRKWRCK